MDQSELLAWLRLLLTPGVGPAKARQLLAAFGSPQAVFDAPLSDLKNVVSARDAASLSCVPADWADHMAATQAWLCGSSRPEEGQREILSLADTRYPRRLLETPDPPLLLFVQGQLSLLDRPSVAVVGSRSPTAQGRDNARAFSQALSEAGVTVVSGLAQGIDGAAHEGALAAQGPGVGATLAVVGTGLDRVYPRSHLDLARRIAERGLLVSEFLLGTPPAPANFPKRNRIVAGLTRGTLVIEAAVQSGSLITARLAAEMGREVLAIPGSIHSPQSRGCHALIKQGAKLVETAQDVLEELHLEGPPVAPASATPDTATESGDPILAAMGFDPVSQEALSARTGMGPAQLGARLLELELMGQVARLPGQLFQRCAQG